MVQQIIKGLSMPETRRKGAAPKYPWQQLQPGDAFKFADGVSFAGARSMASQMVAGIIGAQFAVRQTADGIYCWRIDGTPHALKNGNYGRQSPIKPNYGATAPIAERTDVIGHNSNESGN